MKRAPSASFLEFFARENGDFVSGNSCYFIRERWSVIYFLGGSVGFLGGGFKAGKLSRNIMIITNGW